MEKKYIDAENFKRRVMEAAFEANKQDIYDIAKGICEMVDYTESADVALVVHARWEPYQMPIETRQSGWICTNCSGVQKDLSNGDTECCRIAAQ